MFNSILEKGRTKEDFERAVRLQKKGNEYEDNNLFDEALDYYKKSIELVPEYVDVYLDIGNVYRKQRAYESAKKAFEVVEKISPDWPGLHFYLGVFYCDQGLIDEAIAAFEKERDVSGNDLRINIKLGINYHVKAKLEKKKAVELGVDNKEDSFVLRSSLLEKALKEFIAVINNEPGNLERKRIFYEICQDLDAIRPGRTHELGIKLSLGRLNQVYFPDSLKEKPGDWMWFVDFEFPHSVKSTVVNSVFSDSEGVQWLYADLLDIEKPNFSEYENLPLLGHIVLNSKAVCDVLAYDETGNSILNSDEHTSRNMNNIGNKYYYGGYKQLAKKISQVALNEANTEKDRIACLFNLGYITLFTNAKLHQEEGLKPEQFDAVSAKEINEASTYFNKVIKIFNALSPEEQEELEWMNQDAKSLSAFTLGLSLKR